MNNGKLIMIRSRLSIKLWAKGLAFLQPLVSSQYSGET